jgi:hypothetical protein
MNRTGQAAGADPAGKSVPLDLNHLVNNFVSLRNRKRALEAEHKEQLKPYNKLLNEIGGKLLDYMQRSGVDSVSTPGGTVHQIDKRSAVIRDGEAFRAFIIETGNFDLLDLKANAPAVFDYIKEHEGEGPPGVHASTFTSVGVRSPSEKE